MPAQTSYTVREHIDNPKVKYIQHPNAPRDVYVELKRDTDGKATHFITHYRNVSKEERIDDRSHYDKGNDARWTVLTQEAVNAIIASKKHSNVTPVAVAAPAIPVVTPTPAPVAATNKATALINDDIIEVVKPQS